MAVDRIRSVCDVRSNGALIAQVAPLWIRPDDVLVDVTYGRGLWHTDYLHPGPMTRHDLGLAQDAVDPDGVDFRHLPEPDGSVDVVLFDPTYVAPGGRETSTLAARGADMWDRYGMLTAGRTPAENHEIIAAGVAEIARVLRRPRQQDDGIRDGCGGRLLVKAMDYVCGGRLNPGTDWIKTAAAANCLRQAGDVTMILPYDPTRRPLPAWDLDANRPLGDFGPDRWLWLLTAVRPLPEPIPATGRQGLWEWEPPTPHGVLLVSDSELSSPR